MPSNRERIRIPGDWVGRDRRLSSLAAKTGFRSVNALLAFVAYEVAHCKTPAQLYRAISVFHDTARRK